jgi:hypothetical protein
MTCGRFITLLDAGDTATLGAEALEHAANCEFCGRALAEARALEHALERHLAASTTVPAAFTDRLMSRVEAMPQARLAPADVLRGMLAAFATPPIAASAIAAALLLGFAASAGFDLSVLAARAGVVTAPLTQLLEIVSRPLPTQGLAHDLAVASLVLAVLPLVALLTAAAWQVGNLIGERTPRTL